jgi:hypothetical protein
VDRGREERREKKVEERRGDERRSKIWECNEDL